MIFWDSSAILPLCITETMTSTVRDAVISDPHMVVWWGTRVECISALARRLREGTIGAAAMEQVRLLLAELARHWHEVLPTETLRQRAERLIMVHPLRAADSLQLAAALAWTQEEPNGALMACLDQNLRIAATKEGFAVLPRALQQ